MRAATPRTLGLLAGVATALSPVLAACTAPADDAPAPPAARAAAATEGPAAGAPDGPARATTSPTDPAADPSAGTADVVVTSAAWEPGTARVEVGAFVADVVEVGGRCTLRLTAAARTVTAESTAVADATTTGCALAVAGSELSAGRWTATVEYTSPTSTGRSAPVEIEVP